MKDELLSFLKNIAGAWVAIIITAILFVAPLLGILYAVSRLMGYSDQ